MIEMTRACALLLAGALAGCGPAAPNKADTADKAVKTETPAPNAGDTKATSDATKTGTRAIPPSDLAMKKAELAKKAADPLTKRELELIAADPKDLSREDRRARAYALRKKIMQNPDSPVAQELERIRKSVESGALVPNIPGHPQMSEGGLTFTDPTHNKKPVPPTDANAPADATQPTDAKQPASPAPRGPK
jgi:hypothetical protein